MFPAGVMDRPFLVTVDEIVDKDALPLSDRERFVSRVFEFKKDVPGNFLVDLTVKLRLNAAVTRQDDIEIVLAWLNEETEQWVAFGNPDIDYESGTIGGTINHFTKFAAIARTVEHDDAADAFPDIRGHWAEPSIHRFMESGFVKGYPDGMFRPDRPITRAEFVTILTAALQWAPTGDRTFADSNNHWARTAISTAYAHGLVRGLGDDTFAPDLPITREQMAVMAASALHLEKPKVAPSFTDGEQISPWAREAFEAAAKRAIVSGYPDGTARPQTQATRAEAIMVIEGVLGNREDE